MISRVAWQLERWLLALVAGLAILGLVAPAPARSLVDHHGVTVALVILVGAVGLGLPLSSLRNSRRYGRRVVVTVIVSSATLPFLAWAASRLVPAGPLRLGVLAAGVAPSEVASVALAALAGGSGAISAAVLIGSTAICVLLAGPLLHLLAGTETSFSSGSLLVSLLGIVVLPLIVGLLLRAVTPADRVAQAEASSSAVASIAVVVLIWLVAGQAHLGVQYLRAGAALLLFVFGSAILAALVTFRLPPTSRFSFGLPVAMRDFAIAAGIATEAFGATSAAALGIYGVLVLLLGAGCARVGSRRIEGSI